MTNCGMPVGRGRTCFRADSARTNHFLWRCGAPFMNHPYKHATPTPKIIAINILFPCLYNLDIPLIDHLELEIIIINRHCLECGGEQGRGKRCDIWRAIDAPNLPHVFSEGYFAQNCVLNLYMLGI